MIVVCIYGLVRTDKGISAQDKMLLITDVERAKEIVSAQAQVWREALKAAGTHLISCNVSFLDLQLGKAGHLYDIAF